MITVQEASAAILSQLFKPQSVSCSIHEAVGKVLAEEVVADRDFPPFNRVSMDGIAIHSESWQKGKRKFQIEGVQAAGESQKELSNRDNAFEVMTGAVLPKGTDAVIRYEDLLVESSFASVQVENVNAWQNVHRQGQDARQGDVLISEGMVLSPAEIALLASVGKSTVRVKEFPKTAIVASGDELVEINSIPLPHQIRRSNTYAIEAAMKTLGWKGEQFHLPDEEEILRRSLHEIVEKFDVVILSGGVSQGKFDFIPTVMESIGVKKIFHQVNQRPGKPFWFGASANGKVVFALPGNPVSTYMCFYKYIKPWLLRSMGVEIETQHAILAKDFTFLPKLTYFLQVNLKNESGRLMAYPEAGGGSGDFANLKKIHGFLELPPDRQEFKAGEVFPFIGFRG